MNLCQNKFWVENPCELFCSYELIPTNIMTLEENINAITRLVFAIFIILLLFNTKYSLIFLLLSIVILIFIYYLQIKMINKVTEKFQEKTKSSQKKSITKKYTGSRQHQRTLECPIITSRAYDGHIRNNELSGHSHLNTNSHIDYSNSGYLPSSENFSTEKYVENFEHIEPLVEQNNTFSGESYILKTGGYHNPTENNNLPANLQRGNCHTHEVFSNYNKNLGLQILQPNVYSQSEVIEPINSNIGISHTQQNLPLSISNNNNEVVFTRHNPETYNQPEQKVYIPDIAEHNIVDPRFTGYGTNYRAYNDKVTGQPRFMYDDIDCIKMPNYLCRNKLDFTDFADTYGPIPKGNERGNINHKNIRKLAQDKWLDDNLTFRNNMMESNMKKNNSVMIQRRMAPIHRMY